MSQRRPRARRQTARKPAPYVANARQALRSADAVLGADMSAVPVSRVSQFAIGWMRAAFDQSRVIANLTAAHTGHLAAPNRRAFWELALRLLWLGDLPQAEREHAADAMLAHDRSTEVATDRHMREMGLESNIDLLAMEELVLTETTDPLLLRQAKNLTAAARSTELSSAVIYRLWRDDSTWAHATGFLAGSYAPAGDMTVGQGKPQVVDPNLEAHRLVTMFMVFATYYILVGEGVPNGLASAPMEAFLAVR